MYSAPTSAPTGGVTTWPRRAEQWLDSKGKPAWIIAMVLAFIFIWPVGLALLAYLIWSKRMFSRSCGQSRRHRHHRDHHAAFGYSGNAAFDAYKADMLNRLEDEQRAFEGFLQRLRDAKDKSEFDAFMEDRARAASEGTIVPPTPEAPTTEGRAGAY
jgi:hypothetical protein